LDGVRICPEKNARSRVAGTAIYGIAACALLAACGGNTLGQRSEGVSHAGGAGGVSLGGADAAQSAGEPDASPAEGVADGAVPVCPIRVSGTRVSGANCYACIPPDTQCDPAPPGSPLQGVNAAACAGLFSSSSDFSCEWYADGVPINKQWGVQITCNSNPGRIICGGGL
jgi:hypothetical protein